MGVKREICYVFLISITKSLQVRGMVDTGVSATRNPLPARYLYCLHHSLLARSTRVRTAQSRHTTFSLSSRLPILPPNSPSQPPGHSYPPFWQIGEAYYVHHDSKQLHLSLDDEGREYISSRGASQTGTIPPFAPEEDVQVPKLACIGPIPSPERSSAAKATA